MYFIAGVIISVIIGVIIAKWQMKKNEITHFSINSYDVGKGLHNEFPKFQLIYEDKEIANEVQVLKGGFLNSGRNDIIGLKNNSDINLILPKGCSLKDIKIKKISNDLEVAACINKKAPNVINFAINDEFMAGESFEYTAIIEATEEIRNLHRKIRFKHRIPNTSKIRDEFIISEELQKSSSVTAKILSPLLKERSMGFLSIVASLLFGFFSLFCFFAQSVRYSVIEKETNTEYSLFMTANSQLYITDNVFLPFLDKKPITKDELNDKYIITTRTPNSRVSVSSVMGVILAFLSLIYFLSVFLFFYSWNKKKRIYHLLEQYEKE